MFEWNSRFFRKLARLDAIVEERRAESERTVRLGRKCPHARRRCRQCPAGACEKARALGIQDDGRPLPKGERPTCAARTRQGFTCRAKVVPGKRRCRLHGGLSTGAKTAEGKARQREGYRRWMDRKPPREP
jgi:hypothetical protein